MPKSKTALAGLLVLTVCTAAACGGGQPDQDSQEDNEAAAAHAVTWDELDGVPLPSSADAGPSGMYPAPHGFDRTKLGAGLAAIHEQTALATASDGRWATVLNTVTVPGKGRDEFAAARAVLSIDRSGEVEHPTDFLGYRVTAFDDSGDPPTAAVEILSQPEGSDDLFAYPTALAWVGDDWRIVLPTADDEVDARLVPEEETDDFVLFGGDQQ